MADGIYVALSGAIAESRALDNVAHNIANASTPGYRAERLSFSEALTRAEKVATPQVQVSGSTIDTAGGPLSPTGAELDLAFAGPGYFALETPQGVRYTRNGAFHLDADGTVVSPDGHALLDRDGGRLTVPAGTKHIAVGRDGTVDADGQRVGQILRARIDGPSMTQEGTNLAPKPGTVASDEAEGEIVQGSIERSNFNAVSGMIELIRVTRSFESLTRMIDSYEQLDRSAIQKLGG